jgi:hypothetical protein
LAHVALVSRPMRVPIRATAPPVSYATRRTDTAF